MAGVTLVLATMATGLAPGPGATPAWGEAPALAKPAAAPSIDALHVTLAAEPTSGTVKNAPMKTDKSGRAVFAPRLGLKYAPADELRKMPAARTARSARPAAYNLLNFTPAIVNQGDQSSCVGFATTYAALTIIASVKAGQKQVPFSPSYTYNRGVVLDALASSETPDCGRGMMIETALSLLQGFGAQSLDNFTYSDLECARIPGYFMDQTARQFRISGWSRAQGRDDILQSVVRGVPVVVGMQVPQTFLDYKGGIYDDETTEAIGGHAMAVVGYDDNYHVYLVMNSWGPNWGDHGYSWIKYETLESRVLVDGLFRAFIISP